MTFLLSFVIALSVTVVLMPPLIRAAYRLGFVDVPDARKVHVKSIPRIGGIAMGVGTVLAMVLWRGEAPEIVPVLAGIVVILVFGGLDDRFNLGYRVKFFGQLIAALIVMFYGDVLIERLLFWDSDPLPKAFSIPFTLFALLGVTNAVNLSDGLDGLAGGVTLLSLGAIAVLAWMGGGYGVAIIAVAVMGSIFGFLRFNTHPAQVFMGDAGSQLLGFTAGVLAIVLTQRVEPSLSTVTALFLLGLPIIDTMMVMGNRVREGRSPFSPDKNHIHHRLLALGFDHYEAVLIIYVAQAGLVASGFYFRHYSDALLLAAGGLFCFAVLAGFRWAARTGWRFHGRAVGEVGTLISGRIRWLRETVRITRWVFGYVLASILAYVALAVSFGDQVSRDLGVIALVFFVVMLITYLGRRGEPFGMVERAGLYIVSALAVYLGHSQAGTTAWLGVCDKVFFALLAVAVVVAVIYCWKDRFDLTPLDFLVLFMALMVPFVPGEYFQSLDQRLGVLKLIVLFYAVELVLYRFGRQADALRLITMAGFAAVGVRGLL